MNLLDVWGASWAIEPNKLLEISSVYARHSRGDKIDIAALESKLGRQLSNEQKSYTINQGVAILPIEGVIAKRMNMFSQISGGTSSQMAAAALQQALNDPAVHSIILAIDSPGGTVDGTQVLADAVLAARSGGKAIVTLGSGTMCSAAYWIGSAAQAVYIAESTTVVGSIGVVTTHQDISKAQENEGVKTTEITAGKYKRIASSYAPLSADGRKTIQDQLDYTYSIFVDAVAKNRNVSPAAALAMADGRIFQGQQAIDAGLVDGITTMDALIKRLSADRKAGKAVGAHAAQRPQPLTMLELDKAAKAYMAQNVGVSYLDAVKKFEHPVFM